MRAKGIWIALLLLAACNKEKRADQMPPAAASAIQLTREDQLQAGPTRVDPHVKEPFQDNQYAINEGQRLYQWFNCVGCHSKNGGGNMGPPLIDDYWIYGSEPANIHDTIVKGRPNGMPAFGGRIPDYQIWQLVAYVRFMGRGALQQGVK